MKFEMGKKYRRNSWIRGHYFIVKFVGKTFIFVERHDGSEEMFYKAMYTDNTVTEYKETKKVWMAPALYRGTYDDLYVTSALYKNALEARKNLQDYTAIWPSHSDDLKEYEVPVE